MDADNKQLVNGEKTKVLPILSL